MNVRRMIMLAGAALLLVGVIAMLMPVSVPGPDGKIGCGNGIAADLSQAREVDENNLANLPVVNQLIESKDFVPECESAVASRRTWAIPLAVLGAVGLGASFFVGGRAGRVRA